MPKFCYWCLSVFFSCLLCFVAKRYILQQKCLKEWIGSAVSAVLRTRWYNFQPLRRHSAERHRQTDRQTDRRIDDSMVSISDHTVHKVSNSTIGSKLVTVRRQEKYENEQKYRRLEVRGSWRDYVPEKVSAFVAWRWRLLKSSLILS